MVVNNELERAWKEELVAEFKVLFQHFPGGTEKYNEESEWEWPVCRSKLEPGTSQTQFKSLSLDRPAWYELDRMWKVSAVVWFDVPI
jgi:hypothetical protein